MLVVIAEIICILIIAHLVMLHGRRYNDDWDKIKDKYFAHRGYHDKPEIPENSIPAFERALEHGWGAELDVHLLRDGRLAVFHDSDLKRCTGQDGIIEDYDYQRLKQFRLEGTDNIIPLLDDVLELFEGKQPLIIELKTYNNNGKALAEAIVKKLDNYHGDYVVESFDPRALYELSKLRPQICRGQLAQDFTKDHAGLPAIQRYLLTNLLMNVLSVPDFIAYKYEDKKNINYKLCLKIWGCHEAHWTIRNQKDFDECLKKGAVPIFECFEPKR